MESNDVSDAAAACGLVAFESSTKRTPSITATSAIRCGAGVKLRNPSATALGDDAVRPRERGCGERIRDVVQARNGDVGQRGDLDCFVVGIGNEGPIDQQVLHHPELVRARTVQCERNPPCRGRGPAAVC